MTGSNPSFRDQRASWDEEYGKGHPVWRGPGEPGASLPDKGLALELGCGNGKTLAALSAREGGVVGLDFSRNAMALCRPLELRSERVMLVLGDIARLPFRDEAFSLVLAYHVLDHQLAAGRAAAIGEIERVLRPGGMVRFRGFSVKDLRFAKGREVEPRTYARGRGLAYHYFDEREVGTLFPGLRLASIETSVREKLYHGQHVERAEINASFLKPGCEP